MPDRSHPSTDPAEVEPAIASLVRWAKREGGILSVSVMVTHDDGRSLHESVQLVAAPDETTSDN